MCGYATVNNMGKEEIIKNKRFGEILSQYQESFRNGGWRIFVVEIEMTKLD